VERVLQNTAAQISVTFYTGETIADPGPVTVTVLSDDGTTVASGNAGGTGAVARTFTLTPAHTALLDTLTVRWVSATLGTVTTTVEVVGGFLFTVAEARKLRPLDNTTTYPTADIVAMRTTVEEAIEDACGVAFVPRYDRYDGIGDSVLRLPRSYVRRVRWATSNATALTAGDLSNLLIRAGQFVNGYSWTRDAAVSVGFEHGMDRPPERVRRAALLLAKVWLVSGPVDDRATSFSSTETGATYSMVVPGRGGSVFGVPEADAVVQQYRLPAIV
jgi:hypothetical protein